MDFIFDTLKHLKIYSILYNKCKGIYSIEINRQDQIKKFLDNFEPYHPKWLLLHMKISGGRGLESSGLHARPNGRDNGLQL